MDEEKPEIEQAPDSGLRQLVLEDLNARAQHFGFEDIEIVKTQDPNFAFTLTMYTVKNVAETAGVTRQEVLGTLFELTDEDMADPILDEDAPVGDRVAAFMRFAERHPEIAGADNEMGLSVKRAHGQKNKKD